MGTPALDHPELFALPLVIDPSGLQPRELCLYLSVMHHGFASMSNHGTPTSKETITRTANYFLSYLEQNAA